MRILATVIAGTMLATSAVAEVTVTEETLPALGPVVSGEISLDFAETAANKTGGVMGVDLNIDAGSLASVDLDFSVKDGQALTLDNWTVGTTVGTVDLAFGDDNNLMPETDANTAADGTLAKPAMSESLTASVGGASVAVGLTDWTADITDISNVQGSYTIDMDRFALSGAMDYNVDTENTVFGGALTGLDLGIVDAGGALTYDTDAGLFAYEGTVGTNGLTAYINGNDTNKLQHVGGEYTLNYAGAELSAGVDYDTDAEDFTPTAGLSFSF